MQLIVIYCYKLLYGFQFVKEGDVNYVLGFLKPT